MIARVCFSYFFLFLFVLFRFVLSFYLLFLLHGRLMPGHWNRKEHGTAMLNRKGSARIKKEKGQARIGNKDGFVFFIIAHSVCCVAALSGVLGIGRNKDGTRLST